MSIPGNGISPWLVVFVVVAASGTAGATVLYQDSAREIQAQNDALRSDNAELRERLNASERKRREARTRIEELEDKVETRTEDVESVVSKLDRTERRNATGGHVPESHRNDAGRDNSQLRRRLTVLCSIADNRDRRACEGYGNE